MVSVDTAIGDTEEEIQDIFKEVLVGIRLKFPKFFWSKGGTVNLYHAKVITKYLIEDILKWDRVEVTKSFSADLLKQYKLLGMMQSVFVNSPMAVLENAYPGKYDPKEMQSTFMRHDDKILQKEAIRLRKRFKGLNHEEIVKLYDNAFCVKNRFVVILQVKEVVTSKFQLLDIAFPGKFYEWEFTLPKGFWAIEENRKKATLWLMEKEGTKALTTRQFSKNGLSTILIHGNGIANVICEALDICETQYREGFFGLLCSCHNNGIDLSAKLGINAKVLHSWRTGIKHPAFSFVIENYDKLVEISKEAENTPEELYQKILEGKMHKFPSKY